MPTQARPKTSKRPDTSTPVRDSVDEILAQWATVKPGLDVSPMAVLGRLSRLSRILERHLQSVFSSHGLQPGEFDILATLRRADPDRSGMTAGALATAAMITSGATTNRIDRLVAKGLVTRRTDAANRRTVLVTLTRQGTRLLDKALLEHVANEHALLDSLTPAQRDQLAGLLRTLLVAHHDTALG